MKKLIFTTNSNKVLAEKIAVNAYMRLGRADIKKFADGEVSVFIKENIKNKKVYVLGSSFPPADNLVELLILIHTLKTNGAKKMTVIIPYFGYAKADRVHPAGASLAAKLMAEAIELAGADKIIAVNLHSRRVEKFFKKTLNHLNAIPLLADYFKKKKISNLVVAAPDKGGTDRAMIFAREIGINNIITVEKHRPAFDQAKVISVKGDVKGRNIIIVDDMIQSGGTIINAARALKKQGAKDIYIAVAHFLFTGPGASKLTKEKNIKNVIITDTISATTKLPAKFKTVSIVNLISREIR